jgi:hypothetical protein
MKQFLMKTKEYSTLHKRVKMELARLGSQANIT